MTTVTTDKRDECGCHRECTVTPHFCLIQCTWPACLNDEQVAQLLAEMDDD